MAPKVLISDKMSPKAEEVFKEAGIEVDVKTGLDKEELLQIIPEYDGLVVRSATKVREDLMDAATNLKVIGRAGIGVDNIDTDAATTRGIVVMNTPGGNSMAAAEHALSLMMSLARHIPQACKSLKEGKWEKSKFVGIELYQKTLGIIGLGNIGRIVAGKANGLGMSVIGYDPFVTSEKASKIGVELVSLDELFAQSDFITIHVPKTEDTAGLINKKTIAKMKDGVRLVNASRGGVIVEEDLEEALKTGKIAAAALDVFQNEPPEGCPLVELDNLICTPHLGASTGEAQEKVAVSVARQVSDYLLKGTITNAVNVPSVSRDALKTLKPYIRLAECIGSLQGQLIENPIKSVEVIYSGRVTEYDTTPITLSMLKALLSPRQEDVNYVNARYIAEERGIDVKESTKRQSEDFASYIQLNTTTTRAPHNIGGALFGVDEPRIVMLDGVYLDATPKGNVLVIHNHDKPGVLGKIGSILGERRVNINRLQLGLPQKGGDVAISFINIDNPAPESVLDEIRQIENVLVVKQVKFDA